MSTAERRQRERLQRRTAIIDAAEAVFYERGYQDARMQDIARQAQLSKGALYQYFSSKDDLLLAVTLRWRTMLLDAFAAELSQRRSGLQQVRGLMELMVEFIADHPERMRLMVQVAASGERFAPDRDSEIFAETRERGMRLIGQVVEAIERGKRDGSLRPDLDPVQCFMHFWGGVMGLAMEAQYARIDPEMEPLEQQMGFSFDSLLPGYIEFFIDAIRARHERPRGGSAAAEPDGEEGVEHWEDR